MSRRLSRILSLARMGAPLLPPGSRLRDTTEPVSRARRVARGDLLAEVGPLTLAGATCVWPLVLAGQALEHLRRNGRTVAATSGRSLGSQLMDQLTLAWRHDLSPRDYYRFRLFEPAIQARAARFIPEHELMAIVRRVNQGLDWQRVDDKLAFHEHCRRHDLPTPRLVLSAQGGSVHWLGGPERLPRKDLVLKARKLYGGRGLERWVHDAKSDTWTRHGQTLRESDLVARARDLSRAYDYLIQERAFTHPALADLAPDGVLCTLRVVTCKPPGGALTYLEMLLRTPGVPGQVVDNILAGGIGSNVDPERGELGPGISGVQTFEVHPLTKAPIVGRRVPCWDQVRALCARAHASLPGFVFVGWDVAVTAQGPLLIEANTLFGAPDDPLGDTPFVRVALERIARPADVLPAVEDAEEPVELLVPAARPSREVAPAAAVEPARPVTSKAAGTAGASLPVGR